MITKNEIGQNNGTVGVWFDPEHNTVTFCNWQTQNFVTISVNQLPKMIDAAQWVWEQIQPDISSENNE